MAQNQPSFEDISPEVIRGQEKSFSLALCRAQQDMWLELIHSVSSRPWREPFTCLIQFLASDSPSETFFQQQTSTEDLLSASSTPKTEATVTMCQLAERTSPKGDR